MSNSLVWKSLELVDSAIKTKQEKKKKKQTKYKGTLELIPVKHRIISKRDKIDLSAVLKNSNKISIHEAKEQLKNKKDVTENNVEKLLMLSSSRINSETAEKIFKRALKPEIKKPEKKKAETTLFTEEDFKKFEQEYQET